MKKIFVTGTDTEVGKTLVSELMLQALQAKYKKVLGFKPIAAGCQQTTYGLRNDDAVKLQQASSVEVEYKTVNPFAFEPPVAPHIAAKLADTRLDLNMLQDAYEDIACLNPDLLLIEGAGGWRLPINDDNEFLSDLVIQNQIPVVLVVGMRLGCLNHALLTYQAIMRDNLQCVGWIANQCVEPMPYYKENLHSLQKMIKAPLLAEVHFSKAPILNPEHILLSVI
ncbi:dethiobiotin synthase [Glaciecola sp. 1036]|uniref:dethiobiotin synthase n=1 Tax=Alteromonadaceae TaxID=72275 RepID=UPI003D08B3EF